VANGCLPPSLDVIVLGPPSGAPRGGRSAQTSSDRDVLAAARFSDRRSLSDFWAGFLPVFFGFCEPFIA
jgi:hypothetical protein